MLRCITSGIPSHLPLVDRSTPIHEQRRLLLRLLSRRDVLRVICAPSRYGKTVLAGQYANQVFAAADIAWIDATELSFLLALDAPLSNEFAAQYLGADQQHKLFVFDSCPYLSEQRFSALTEAVCQLIEAGHEVLLTTTDLRWAKLNGLDVLVVNARELLLDEDERRRWDEAEAERSTGKEAAANSGDHSTRNAESNSFEQLLTDSENGFDLSLVPGFRQAGAQAHDALYRSLVNTEIHSEQDAVAHLATLLGSGALHELTTFTQTLPTGTIVHLEQHVPHCGVKRLDPMFHAAPLSNDEKFLLVQSHLTALTDVLPKFSEEDALVAALVDCFMRRGEELLATQLVCGLHDDGRKAGYFDRYGKSFLLDTRPLALLKLASSLPRSFFATLERWQLIILALGLLGDGKHADLALDAFQRQFCQDTESSEGSCEANLHLAQVPTPCTSELFAALARIVFETEFDRDPNALLPCVRNRLKEVQASQAYAASPLTYTLDLLELIEQMLVSPHKAIVQLERIASKGYTVKECLAAAALFVQLLIHFWNPQLLSDEDPADQPARRPALSKARARKESELLERLEGHITRLLARQESTLSANSYELFLFEKAQHIFGDRAYLFASDELLQRIEAGRTSLIEQRRQWRAQQAAGALKLNAPKQRPKQAEAKKLRINTLGRFEIESRDPSITIKSKVRKQLRLLISLLAINEGREVARPWIQRIMWPDAPERNARQNLYSMWSLLNKSITNEAGECPFFESFPQSVSLNETLVETDIHMLVHLCKRLRTETLDTREYEIILDELEDVYRGPLLPGLETAEVVAYRKRYQDHLLEALIQSGLHLRKQGKTSLALRYFRFAFENEPTREDVCYQLMMALWKLGRHGEALNEYFVCRRALIDEFGVEGTARLRELYESILRDAS